MGIDREWEMVREFHLKFNNPAADKPVLMETARAEKRYSWMLEELDEFMEAVREGDLVEQADAMIDLIYFALGTMVEMGVRPEQLFAIVQKANMDKLWEDGKPHYRADGKTIKPEGWTDPHPNLAAAIEQMGAE